MWFASSDVCVTLALSLLSPFPVCQSLHALQNMALYGLTPTSTDHEKIAELLEREAILLAGLRHPNIVQFYGIVLDPGTGLPLWIVQELASGSLKAYLKKRGAESGGVSLQELWLAACAD